MASRVGWFALVVLALLATSSPNWAEGPAPGAAEPVKVWTNADLLRMFGPPSPTTPRDPKEVEEAAARDRAFVQSVIDQEYARIRADEEQLLRRRELGLMEATPAVDEYAAWGLPWAWGTWSDNGGDRGSRGFRPHVSPHVPRPGQPGWNEFTATMNGASRARARYFSPYSPKPGQPGWNEMVMGAAAAQASRRRR